MCIRDSDSTVPFIPHTAPSGIRMPPSSKRARATRKTADANDVSDAETPESIATPSRPTRKRGRASDAAPNSAARVATRRKTRDTRQAEREDTEGTEANEQSDAETEPSVPTELEIISKLKVPDRLVYARQDFANDLLEGKENVPGYGKIAGRDWTYIIKELEVNIGRPEQHEKVDHTQTDIDNSQTNDHSPSHKSNISIDLGPDRQTSRLHAIIQYDPDQGHWYITINGRNGLRVDTNLLKRGQKAVLRSGSVIDICGTQMAFITTATDVADGPVFADAIIRQVYASEDEDGGGDGNDKSHAHHDMPDEGPARNGNGPPGFSDDQPSSSRVHPHSQAGTRGMAFAPPGTPIRQQQGFQPQYSRPSPASTGYARGVMMESTEAIDYASDASKDLKPPHSYAQLIGMAILSTSEQQMTLNNIYKWIMANYAFYRFNTGGWQNSIRHNLSLNKAFEKIARRTDEPGKGMKWMISPKERDTFLSQGMKGCRRPNPMSIKDSSDPASPALLGSGTFSLPKANSKLEDTQSPPLNMYAPAYPTAKEAFTPDRGSRRPINSLDDHDPELSYYPASAKSTLNHLTAAAHAAGSPSALYMNEDRGMGMLDTPFPVRSSQKLMPPSTMQRPSAFMDFSSPAPFWKFGSTPLKPLADMSPMKTPFSTFKPLDPAVKAANEDAKVPDAKATVDVKDGNGTNLQPSSPPQSASADTYGDGSPSRSISRPATSQGRTQKPEPSPALSQATHATQATSEQNHSSSQPSRPTLQPAAQIGSQGNHGSMQAPSQVNGNAYTSVGAGGNANGVAHAHAPNMTVSRYDTEEEDGIDLMK